MKILGIDYGRKKIGMAIADGPLAEPWKIVKYSQVEEVIKRLSYLVAENEIDKIVVGISEGEMGEESKEFSLNLSKKLDIPVETFDETLSTQEAQRLSIEAGIKRKKRRGLEDAYAASVVLQSYIDSNV